MDETQSTLSEIETQQKIDALRSALAPANAMFEAAGMVTIDVVRPSDCIPQEINARYMNPETMENLVKNLRRDKRLESAPLVTPSQKVHGKYETISGHHRVEAAEKAHIPFMLVFVVKINSEEELVAKQLSHNAISGKDNEVVLKKMFDSLQSIDLKYYSGLQDVLESINPVSLSFRAGQMHEFTLVFMPEEIEKYDDQVALIEEEMKTSGVSAVVRVVSHAQYEQWSDAIRKIKRVENIKNNAVAFARIMELANERLDQIRREIRDKNAGDADAVAASVKINDTVELTRTRSRK